MKTAIAFALGLVTSVAITAVTSYTFLNWEWWAIFVPTAVIAAVILRRVQ